MEETPFELPTSERSLYEPALMVDVDGFEGPLDLLLALARNQQVDLTRISILALANQYLAFIEQARELRIEIAADYLVMAAWLAYLKSRLLLPRSGPAAGPEPDAGEVAARLAFRLAKLDAMRQAAEALKARPILGRDVFARGYPQAVRIVSHRRLEGDLYALMSAYVGQKKRERDRCYRPAPAQSYPLDDARERLRDLLPDLAGWTSLAAVAPAERDSGPRRASLLASTLSASLEMVREGDLEARQIDHFAEIWLRARKAAA